MSVLSVHNLTMTFIERNLFTNVTFEVEKGDKVGFIGANGAGKTTLFKIINGELESAAGDVFISRDTIVGYMEQHACTHPERTVYEELLTVFSRLREYEQKLNKIAVKIEQLGTQKKEDVQGKLDALIAEQAQLLETFEREGGLTYKSRTRSSLLGLGFKESEFSVPTGRLSGGQRSKLSLAKLLLSQANFLLLDEPTNHLDMDSICWLEGFIKDFKGAMLIISHDRYFLDNVTNKTIELEHRKLRAYTGNYSDFIRKKEAEEEAVRNKYENDLKEIKRIEGIVEQQRRWGRERNFITAESKQKEADRIREQLVAPDGALEIIRMRFEPKRETGKDVLICENLAKSFGEKKLFSNLDLHVRKGERVFILGGNGCGKTTLFNILMRKIPADSGEVRFGANVDAGYFDQMQKNLHLEKTAIDEVWDTFPQMTQTQVRTALGSFLFKGDEVFKPLSKMSGGERARVSLLKLMLSGSNFLLLDEPTNHLDASSREQLEKTLKEYAGTMLIISHDRYFINKLADRILVMTPEGFTEYLGNYDAYLEKISSRKSVSEKKNTQTQEKPKNAYQLQKQKQAEQRKRKNLLVKTEERIEQLDVQISETNLLLQSDAVTSDYEKLMELTKKLEKLQEEQEQAYIQWEALSEEEALN